eukprot:1140086-Pelagomonas_calceolata.AAC.11
MLIPTSKHKGKTQQPALALTESPANERLTINQQSNFNWFSRLSAILKGKRLALLEAARPVAPPLISIARILNLDGMYLEKRKSAPDERLRALREGFLTSKLARVSPKDAQT